MKKVQLIILFIFTYICSSALAGNDFEEAKLKEKNLQKIEIEQIQNKVKNVATKEAVNFATGVKKAYFCKNYRIVEAIGEHSDGAKDRYILVDKTHPKLEKDSYSKIIGGQWTAEYSSPFQTPVKSSLSAKILKKKPYRRLEIKEQRLGKEFKSDQGTWSINLDGPLTPGFNTKGNPKAPIPFWMAYDLIYWGSYGSGLFYDFEVGKKYYETSIENTFDGEKIPLAAEIEITQKLDKHSYQDSKKKSYDYKDCFEVKYTIVHNPPKKKTNRLFSLLSFYFTKLKRNDYLSLYGYTHMLKASSEKVGPDFLLKGLLSAQNKTKELTSDIIQKIQSGLFEGLTESEARKKVIEFFKHAGVQKHWHVPFVRFGPGTVLTFADSPQKDYRLKLNDPCFIDVGPVWIDADTGIEYEGDYGSSFVYGSNPKADNCIQAAKSIFDSAQKEWNSKKLTGIELYHFVKNQTNELGYDYLEPVQGHRISDFPHSKYGRGSLGDKPFIPSSHVWVFEVQIKMRDAPLGAFFEDLL